MFLWSLEFSHRYGALAAGIGRLGWSGNLLTREHGALVELGSVLTSATLTADTPIPDNEHPCDGCKMCSQVCPVDMIHPRESIQVNVAGVTETISSKRPNTCCCTGYEGLATSRTWSNWSPFRLGHPLAGENAVEVPTPFGLRVVVPETELSKERSPTRKWPGQFPLDREIIEYLVQHVKGTSKK